ncbi:MAG: YfhO family protein [Roseburia sp.]
MKTAKEDNEETGSGFYRVEDTERKTKNDDSLYGYASATIFSSLMNLDVSHLFQSLFMEGGKNFYCYNGATPLSSSLFSVKYMLSDSALEESPYRYIDRWQWKQFPVSQQLQPSAWFCYG